MRALRQTLVVAFLAAGMLWAQNVGIGTTTPLTRLHVAAGDIFLGDATGNNGFVLHSRDGMGYDYFQITSRTAGSYEWGKGITFVRSTGNVGIGTVAPAERLHVQGNIRFSGALMPAGNAGTTGQVLVSQGPGVAPNWFPLLTELNASGAPTGNTGFKICFGESNAWVDCGPGRLCTYNTGVLIDIDMSGCGFTSTPYVFTAIKGTAYHWVTTGATSIYFLTSTSFRVYVHGYLYSGGGLNTTAATNYGYTLMWMAIGR